MAKKKKNLDDENLTNEEREELKKEEQTKYAKKDIFLDVAPYLIIIFFVIIIRTFICSPVTVNGTSMYPTLHDGDYMLLYKLTKKFRGIRRFDIVVVNTKSGRLVKRVIGLPGENIRYEVKKNESGEPTEGILYVNGKKVDEDFFGDDAKSNPLQTCVNNPDICSESGVNVPENEYYVMGDNRGNSTDSRIIGTVSYDSILGTTNVILYPFSRIGKAK